MNGEDERKLSDDELQALSFMHYYLAVENDPAREATCNVQWDTEPNERRAMMTVGGGVLLLSPLLFLRRVSISLVGWRHCEVFRDFPQIGWATETRQPINPPMVFHHVTYQPGFLRIKGVGQDPMAHYVWVFEGVAVEAYATIDPEQELLRQAHQANLALRKQQLEANPHDARLRIPLDVEDAKFLKSIIAKARQSGKQEL